MTDFFDSTLWGQRNFKMRQPLRGKLRDRLFDLSLATSARWRQLPNQGPVREILIAGIEVSSRPSEIHDVIGRLSRSRHRITTSIVPLGDRGKFANIDEAIRLAPRPLDTFDWLIIADDDIRFAKRFLDRFIGACEAADLAVAQPAHCFDSFASFGVTQRRWGTLARQTRFVEIGPLTALRRDTFADLIPFPASRWGWGIDILWASISRARGWKMGVVDATPVRHMRPVGGSYDTSAAIAEGKALLDAAGVTMSRAEMLVPQEPLETLRR